MSKITQLPKILKNTRRKWCPKRRCFTFRSLNFPPATKKKHCCSSFFHQFSQGFLSPAVFFFTPWRSLAYQPTTPGEPTECWRSDAPGGCHTKSTGSNDAGLESTWCTGLSRARGVNFVNKNMRFEMKKLGGGFKYFLFSPLFAEDSNFD